MIQQLRKLQHLKYAFILILVIQLFLCILGSLFIYKLITSKNNFSQQIEHEISREKDFQRLQELIQKTVYPSKENPESLRIFYFQLGELSEHIHSMGDSKLIDIYKNFEKKPDQMKSFPLPVPFTPHSQLHLLQVMQQEMDGLQKQIIITGLLSLLFGFIFPLLIIKWAFSILSQFQKSLRQQASEMTSHWMEELKRFEGEPFKNIHFWVHILLLTLSRAGHFSHHPAYQLVADLAAQIKQELEKQETSSSDQERAPSSSSSSN